jgi:serine/threonine protein kinase
MSAKFPQPFGKYTLLRKLATGGMAELFLAKAQGAEGFERELVVKRILPHFSEDADFVKMFIDEASLTSKLQHQNIVQIYDFDVVDRQYYIAMEFIDGEDLQNLLKDGQAAGHPLSVAQCVAITIELAKGLHYAHTKEHKGKPLNIIHRDISPHNAMVSYSGQVKLMDFGIAKAAERSTKTQAGMVKGKVAYMSPEQARGKQLDGRSDLFALAIMLWEMLCNKRLFLRGNDFETLTAVLKETPARPSTLRPEVDQELDDIIMTALEKDREHRQKNVEEFQRELTRWYYKNVQDLDGESLKTFMQTLYGHKLAQRNPTPDAGATVRAVVEPMGTPPRRATQAGTGAAPRTLKEQAPQPSFNESATLLEGEAGLSKEDIERALSEARSKAAEQAAARAGGGARTPSQTSMSAAGGSPSGQRQAPVAVPQPVADVTEDGGKSNNMLWIIIAVLVLGGGATALLMVLK